MDLLLPNDFLLDPYSYKIVRQLGKGEGGMSSVYLARLFDPALREPGIEVALKFARQDSQGGTFFQDTLNNEIEQLLKLRNPGIVRLHPIRGRTVPSNAIYTAQTTLEGRPWFSVMEFLAGGSLSELLAHRSALPLSLALQIAHCVARTLAYIHEQQRVHLDIKPENVVFREPLQRGREADPVLVDFGITRAVGQGGLAARTVLWSAPERIEPSSGTGPPRPLPPPAPSMDVYALGLLLYGMAAGRLPYSQNRSQVTSEILQGNPRPPSTFAPALPAAFDALVMAALAYEPSARPSAATLAQQIHTLRANSPDDAPSPHFEEVLPPTVARPPLETPPARPAPPRPSPPRPAPPRPPDAVVRPVAQRRWALPLGALLALLLLGGAWAAFTRPAAPPQSDSSSIEPIVAPASATRTRRAASATTSRSATTTPTRPAGTATRSAVGGLATSTGVATRTNTPLPTATNTPPPTATFRPATSTAPPIPTTIPTLITLPSSTVTSGVGPTLIPTTPTTPSATSPAVPPSATPPPTVLPSTTPLPMPPTPVPPTPVPPTPVPPTEVPTPPPPPPP